MGEWYIFMILDLEIALSTLYLENFMHKTIGVEAIFFDSMSKKTLGTKLK